MNDQYLDAITVGNLTYSVKDLDGLMQFNIPGGMFQADGHNYMLPTINGLQYDTEGAQWPDWANALMYISNKAIAAGAKGLQINVGDDPEGMGGMGETYILYSPSVPCPVMSDADWGYPTFVVDGGSATYIIRADATFNSEKLITALTITQVNTGFDEEAMFKAEPFTHVNKYSSFNLAVTGITGVQKETFYLISGNVRNVAGGYELESNTWSQNYTPCGILSLVKPTNNDDWYLMNITPKDVLKSVTGYDATKTQVLKNVNGTLTWVDE